MKLTIDEQNRILVRAIPLLYGRQLKEVATTPAELQTLRDWYFDPENELGHANQNKRRQPRNPTITNESEIPTQ